MTDAKKEGLSKLRPYIELISNEQMYDFVISVFNEYTPDIFWESMASSSGLYHKGETNVEHLVYCMELGKHVVRQMTQGLYPSVQYWCIEQCDCFYTALLLHDCFKYGTEDIKRFNDKGVHITTNLHPVFNMYILKDIPVQVQPGVTIPARDCEWYEMVMLAIAGHSGPWSPLSVIDPMQLPANSIAAQVHIVDYFASRHNITVEETIGD